MATLRLFFAMVVLVLAVVMSGCADLHRYVRPLTPAEQQFHYQQMQQYQTPRPPTHCWTNYGPGYAQTICQ